MDFSVDSSSSGDKSDTAVNNSRKQTPARFWSLLGATREGVKQEADTASIQAGLSHEKKRFLLLFASQLFQSAVTSVNARDFCRGDVRASTFDLSRLAGKTHRIEGKSSPPWDPPSVTWRSGTPSARQKV